MDNANMTIGRPRASRVKITRADGTVEYAPAQGRRQPIPLKLQREVFARDGLRCRYCGYRHKSASKFEVDHVVPRSKGGADSLANLVVACVRCNQAKGTDVWDVKIRPRYKEWGKARNRQDHRPPR
jgi:5-methylcytosine-specific restriction endonuclease McrA